MKAFLRLAVLATPVASFQLLKTCTQSTPRNSRLFNAVSTKQDLVPGIDVINASNEDVHSCLAELRETPHFRLFSVDILASCEYMPQELFECYSETCEIYPIDDDEVPESIRRVDMSEADFDIDGWGRWDMPSNDYYDTEEFPEGYTGYDGSEIWKYIHQRLCFSGYGYDDEHWKADFNKAVSGLHSVISAQVVRGIQDKVDAGEEFSSSEVWRVPKLEFERRLSPRGETPLALENLYFAYMLVIAAVAKAKDRLLADCQSGKIESSTVEPLITFLSLPILEEASVSTAASKVHSHVMKDVGSRECLWEARMRARELMRVMNCVQCNKCRLHGKISIMGLTTALQVLLGANGEGADPNRLHRVELAALISTLYKFSTAVQFCQTMMET